MTQPDMIKKRPTRIEAAVTSISWIPSEAISSLSTKLPFEMGIAHYDQAPPDEVTDLVALRDADRFRFANQLRGWVEVEDGRIVAQGSSGGGMIGATTLRLGSRQATFQAVPLPDLRPEPTASATEVTFVQTAGGRTGVPAPRRVFRPPFVQISAPLAWTTLSLTIRADGTVTHQMTGASPFPRHWVYDGEGRLSRKSGLTDFTDWYRKSFARRTPWGVEDSEALVTAVESALEHSLSVQLMRGAAKPSIRRVRAGDTVVRQGQPGAEVYLVLDGVIRVERDGKRLAEYGPGALLGERAHLEGGTRTSTLVAVTPCRMASLDASQFERSDLAELSAEHRREDADRG